MPQNENNEDDISDEQESADCLEERLRLLMDDDTEEWDQDERETCEECNGRGRDMQGWECQSCDGTGYIE